MAHRTGDGTDTERASDPGGPAPSGPSGASWTVRAAAAVAGVAVTWLVVRSGSPAGRVLRGLIVPTLTVGTVVALGRWGPARRAALLVVVGPVVLAAGLGVAAQWATEGWSPTAVAGVLAASAGLVLVGGAVGGALRAVSGWRRWLAGAAVVVAALVVVAVVAVPVAATNVPPGPRPPRTAELAGEPADEVRFRAADGVELAGWWVPGVDGRAVVVVPGSGSTRVAAREEAAELVRAGYGVLVVDHRGHGASGGTAMDFGWHGDEDVRAAVDEVVRRGAEPGKVAVLGLSMGGEEALGAMAADPRIGAVVAEGATGRTAADRGWLSEQYGAAGTIQEALDRVTYGVVDLLTSAGPPRPLAAAVRAADGTEVLLVAAGEVPDEGRVARRLRRLAPDRVEVWEVAGSGHTAALATDPDGWRRRVLGHLDRVTAGS